MLFAKIEQELIFCPSHDNDDSNNISLLDSFNETGIDLTSLSPHFWHLFALGMLEYLAISLSLSLLQLISDAHQKQFLHIRNRIVSICLFGVIVVAPLGVNLSFWFFPSHSGGISRRGVILFFNKSHAVIQKNCFERKISNTPIDVPEMIS